MSEIQGEAQTGDDEWEVDPDFNLNGRVMCSTCHGKTAIHNMRSGTAISIKGIHHPWCPYYGSSECPIELVDMTDAEGNPTTAELVEAKKA